MQIKSCFVVLFIAFSCLILSACSSKKSGSVAEVTPVQFFERGAFPEKLSQWRLFDTSNGELVPNVGVVPYDLKSALFTDYAHKFRTVYVPTGLGGEWNDRGVIDLPEGSIMTKTFYYPKSEAGIVKSRSESDDYSDQGLRLEKISLIETRLLVRTSEGWIGLPYLWNEAGTEAILELTGAQIALTFVDTQETFHYSVPDFNQCQGCHIENLATGDMAPIGFKSHHLDKPYPYIHAAENQLIYLAGKGYLPHTAHQGLTNIVAWQDEESSLEDRARSYLDINCGHCHNPTGPADTSGMFLTRDTSDNLRLGLCKPPVAAGQGTGGRPVGISPGKPEQSITAYRMGSVDLGAMMPELGRSLVHAEGVTLIEDWIRQMDGGC